MMRHADYLACTVEVPQQADVAPPKSSGVCH
jgi:hypothetical protein